MTHASLFSGIGGFDLAAQNAGMINVFQVEIDKFCQKILTKNFPNVKRYKDIREFNASEYRNTIDVISGGFPCQPFSQAGKRKGKEDDRYLWNEMLRVIAEIKPRWVVAENVYGLLTIDNGMVFKQIIIDLENQGYEVQTFIIPALAVGALHKRNRLWIIANAQSPRLQSRELRQGETQFWRDSSRSDWLEVATALCRVDDGLPRQLDRSKRIKALGNSIVPQIAEIIFKTIIEIDYDN